MTPAPIPRAPSLLRRGVASALALLVALAAGVPDAGASPGAKPRATKQKAGVHRSTTPGKRPSPASHQGATITPSRRQAQPAARPNPRLAKAPPAAAHHEPTPSRGRSAPSVAKEPTESRPPATAARQPVAAKHPGKAPAASQPRRVAAPSLPAPEPLVIEDLAWHRFGLVLQTSAAFKPAVSILANPSRFVIDLPAAEFADPALKRTIQVDDHGVKQVRMSKQGNGVRIVLDCDEIPAFQVMQLRDRSMLVVARAGQDDPGLKALVDRFSDEGEPADPADGQQLAGVWAREAADRLTLHVGLKGGQGLRYQLFQPSTHQLRLRVPGGSYTGSLPGAGRLLRRVEAASKGSAWTMEVTLADGHYELSETRDDEGGITFVWERINPRGRDGMPLVVIDPGHGGADPGAIGPSGRTEKAVCLSLARALRDTLRRHGYNAILTRGVDAEMYLAPRLAMIDRWQADLFVSLHANSHTSHEANGIETFYREPGSAAFAQTVHRTVATLLRRPDRGTKQDRLYVLRHGQVPSLLLEAGFISNPREERLLDDATYQAQAAFAIAVGIENFRVAPLVQRAPQPRHVGGDLLAALRSCGLP